MQHYFFMGLAVGVNLGALVLIGNFSVQPLLGGASLGLPASIASSSAPSLSAVTATSIFATSTSCTARIISTQAGYLMLTFSDYAGQSPAGSFGHYQAASTTVAYDSGQVGCGLVKAYSNIAQKITITDAR